MPLIINTERLTGELNRRFSIEGISDNRLNEMLIEEACPIIEARLADPNYVRSWTWEGKQAFYDDERYGVKEIRGGIFSKGYGDHLKNQFHATPGEGYMGIEITNDKEVTSSRGTFNLFELLWHGFGPYTASKLKQPEGSYSQWLLKQSKRAQRRLRRELTVYTAQPITFYYRYKGMWFYKLQKRKGFTPSLHSKFRQYITGAVEYGFQRALENIENRGRT
jgi:hypothetical protein